MAKSHPYTAGIFAAMAVLAAFQPLTAGADTIVVRPPVVIEKEVPPPPPPPPSGCEKTTVKTENDNGTTVSKTVSCPDPDAPPSDE